MQMRVLFLRNESSTNLFTFHVRKHSEGEKKKKT